MELNNEDMVLNNNFYNNAYNHTQMVGVDTLSEELQLILRDKIPSPLFEDTLSTLTISSSSNNNNNDNNTLINPTNLTQSLSSDDHSNSQQEERQQLRDDEQNEKRCKQDDNVAKGRQRRRIREASQVQNHVISERTRRELHAKRFIALSAMIPDLKKMDKTSILQHSIKYIKELQENVETLEEVLLAKQNAESTTTMMGENDEDDQSVRMVDENVSLSQVETKISNDTLLLKIYCENRDGIMSKILAKVEKYEMKIVHTNMMQFGPSATNIITIVTQMEKVDNKHVKILVTDLYSLLHQP
ncbi:hypothetical protein vseg_003812 [Gypsophila vaccaria]